MKKISKKEYKELFEKVDFKTFFHNPEWHDFLEKEFRWLKFEYYLYRDKTIFPLARIGKKLISLPFCEYGGPLGDFDEKDILKNFKNIKVKVHPRIKTGESNVSTHWIENLNSLSEQELFNSFRKTLRHSIRDAQKNNLEIKECPDFKSLKQFYNLYVDNLRRKKTVPYPFSVIKFLCNYPNLQMKSQSTNTELLLAIYKGRVIAGDLFLHYNPFVHYFISASDYKYRKLGANYLLLWGKIKSLIGKDIIFDFGASPRGSKLEIFKRGWGGTEMPIYQIGIKRSEESLRSSKLRNIWKLLPNFVIKLISPYFIKYRI